MMRTSISAGHVRISRWWTVAALGVATAGLSSFFGIAAGAVPAYAADPAKSASVAAADMPAETLPDGVKVTSLEAFPTSLELRSRFDYRQLLVLGRTDEGELVDLTRMAKLAAPAQTVNVSPMGLVTVKADGQEQLSFRYGDSVLKIDVKVSGAGRDYEPSFVRDIQPALSKMGCNQGTCHGAKDGKVGFKLSLRGYDPLYDHRSLVDDIGGRRFNRAAPDQSLMLLKATGSIPHVGGVRMNVGEPYYELLRSWIAGGVKQDLSAPRVASIEVFPKNPIVPRPGMKQQMAVIATLTDGSVRDVTREAFVESGDIEVIEANAAGVLTLLRRGEAPVLVRYDGAYAATTIICMGDRAGFAWTPTPTNNYIDEWVHKKLQRVKVAPSEMCTDEEFIRRVYLDLAGLPPAAELVRAFLADGRPTRVKRDELIDRLIGSPEFVEHWTNKWADLLQVNRKFLGEEGSVALRNWIKAAVASNMPYDQFAREILTASGSNVENPPAAYFKHMRQPQDLMENTTHLFLAIRFNCNKCHDHPFERWTQDQYYEMSAYFAQIARKEDPSYAGQKIGGSAVEGAAPLVEVIYDSGSGEVKHDRTGQVTAPAFPYQRDIQTAGGSRREQLSSWMTSKDNQYFAKSYVNRLWGYLFGRGIIEPIDDIRAGNPPTNPELLDALSRDFIASGFDMRHMLRTICQSRVYQLSVKTNEWNKDDEINHARALPRRLPAEVLFDAIHVATGSTPRVPGAPAGARAAELPDAGVSVPFLEDFGRPVRESACECERSSGMVLGPVMKLINGPTVADAIADPANRITKLVAEQPDDRLLIEEVFLRFLARKPTAAEVELGLDAIRNAGSDHDKLVASLREYENQLNAKQAAWEKTVGKEVVWTPVEIVDFKSPVGATHVKKDDGSILVSGAEGHDTYTVTAATTLAAITGLRLEALPDAALPAGGPGRAMNGNFVLNELRMSIAPKADAAKKDAVGLHNGQATFSQDSWAVGGAVDGNEATGWAVHPKANEAHTAIFETKTAVGAAGGSVLTFEFVQKFQDGKHLLGRFRLSVTTSPVPFGGEKLPAEVAAALAVAAEQRTPEQKATLANYFRGRDTGFQELTAAVQRSAESLKNRRLLGVQDLAWALINNPAFLFNR